MGEREKGAMFNSLSGDLDGARVLDAFAGSGALGFEALSRGAATAVFVDNARGAAEVIKRNAEELGAEARVYAMSVEKFINFYEKFDIVFADPPYNRPQYKVVERLAGLVARGGLFVLSQAVEDEALALDNFELLSSKVYAGARILVYRLV
jgi:16S rRNA (guanine966-N2)-methyltransferase